MEIRYKFADDTTSTVEVSEEIGTFILDSRRVEANANRRERYHCWSLEATPFEGSEFGEEDYHPSEDDTEEQAARIRVAFSHLSETQRRRMLMVAQGMTLREIAKAEGAAYSSVKESIDTARKKFLKFF